MADSPRDMAGSEYWDDARPVRHSAGRLRRAVHRVLNRKFDRMLRTVLEAAPQGAVLLELGCAPGWTLVRLGRIRPDLELVGLDYAATGVAQTKQMLADEGVEGSVAEGDIREHEPSRPIDVAFSAGLVEHYSDVKEPLQHHRRLARPGGLVAVTVPNLRAAPLHRAAQRFEPQDLATHNLDIMTPAALEAALEEIGLEEIRSGRGGGAAMFVPRRRADLSSRAYTFLAYGWNLLAAVLPDAISPWHVHVWATGRVPLR